MDVAPPVQLRMSINIKLKHRINESGLIGKFFYSLLRFFKKGKKEGCYSLAATCNYLE